MQLMEASSWSNFKSVVNTRSLAIQYLEMTDRYEIFAPEVQTLIWHISILKDGGVDVTDFEANYKPNANRAVAKTSLEVTQLSFFQTQDTLTSHQITQLTTLELYGSQEIAQLSNILINGITASVNTAKMEALLTQEVSQLTTLELYNFQEVTQLTTLQLYGFQEVTQLSNIVNVVDGLSIVNGRLLVSQEPPSPPPATTAVIQQAQSTVSGTSDTIYTIPNGKTLIIQRFRGGAVPSTNGCKVEIWYDPNGTGAGMTLIDVGYVDGSNFLFDESTTLSYVGNGTRAIRLRRVNFSGGNLETYGRWDGYYS